MHSHPEKWRQTHQYLRNQPVRTNQVLQTRSRKFKTRSTGPSNSFPDPSGKFKTRSEILQTHEEAMSHGYLPYTNNTSLIFLSLDASSSLLSHSICMKI